jgi:hypothetical protein
MQRSDFLLAVIDERYLSVAKVPSSHSASRARALYLEQQWGQQNEMSSQ